MASTRTRRIARAAVAAATLLAVTAVGLPSAFAIYKGSEADRDYPFMASLQFKTSTGPVHWCGASLIAPRWVATAKHCMLPSIFNRLTRPSDLQLRVGSRDRTRGGELVDVVKIVVHGEPIDPSPTGSNDIDGTDIALLKLARPVAGTPVAIAPTSPKPKTAVRLLGWGYDCQAPRPLPDAPCPEIPARLRQLDTTILKRSACVSKRPDDAPIADRELCQAIAPDGGNARSHDSGGPMLLSASTGYQLVGLVSGPVSQDFTKDGPVVHTDVTAYRAWIGDQLKRG